MPNKLCEVSPWVNMNKWINKEGKDKKNMF